MKKIINRSLALVFIIGTINNMTHCRIVSNTKTNKAQVKAHSRKESSMNKSLNADVSKLAEMESTDASQTQIDKQKSLIARKKDEAIEWIQKTYQSVTEMSPAAKALMGTVTIAGAAIATDWYFGTGYLSGAKDWLYKKMPSMPSREMFGFGTKPISQTPIRELPGKLTDAVGEKAKEAIETGILTEETGSITAEAIENRAGNRATEVYEKGKKFFQQSPEQLREFATQKGTTDFSVPLTQTPLSKIPGKIFRGSTAGAVQLAQDTSKTIQLLGEKTPAELAQQAQETAAPYAQQAKDWFNNSDDSMLPPY